MPPKVSMTKIVENDAGSKKFFYGVQFFQSQIEVQSL
jgi:hypothetical protein